MRSFVEQKRLIRASLVKQKIDYETARKIVERLLWEQVGELFEISGELNRQKLAELAKKAREIREAGMQIKEGKKQRVTYAQKEIIDALVRRGLPFKNAEAVVKNKWRVISAVDLENEKEKEALAGRLYTIAKINERLKTEGKRF